MTRHLRLPALVVLGALATFACTGSPAIERPTPLPAGDTARAAAGAMPTPAAPAAASPHPVSLPARMQKTYDGRDLRTGRVLARTDAYIRYAVTYESGDLTISGVMNVPRGNGPFPVLVLAHGYIDADVYTTGRGLMREQDHLARRGYVVLHTDYRNHAGSDDDADNELELRLGYTEDVINAVLAVKGSELPALDGEWVGLLGRSMGGGIAYNVLVAQPDLLDAAVVFAPTSSDAVDNFDRWTRGEPGQRRLTRRILDAYGSPEDNPEFWRGVSARTFFDRVRAPLLMHHGTSDDTCPIVWSQETLEALQRAGKDVQLDTYEGEEHAFGPAWPSSMRRTTDFFDRHLRS
ncbi:MAG: prolyl oligopeptidase family serine peptidase [Actinomycetota bacterium]|nr:prolyl oligopeptidase family serine peptidase [Actinomycetota bacterium]